MEIENPIACLFMESIHANNGQTRRYERAMQAECTPDFVYTEKKTAIFSAKGGGGYETSLEECSCPDYEKREDGFPCKHMYRLAMELGILNETFDFGLNGNKQEGALLSGQDLLSSAAKEIFLRLHEIYQKEHCSFFILQRSTMIRELVLCELLEEYTGSFYPVFTKAHEATLMNSLSKISLSEFKNIRSGRSQKTRKFLLEWEEKHYKELHENLVAVVLTKSGEFYWDYLLEEEDIHITV